VADTVLDVVLLPPDPVRARALAAGRRLAERMAHDRNPSYFRLGEPFPGRPAADLCEPHISLFMLTVDETEVPDVAAAVGGVAAVARPLSAEGFAYDHNPYGAPEVYYRPSSAWTTLQRAVVAAVEPLRRGRLRELDPAGEKLRDVVSDQSPPDPDRVRQLRAYGYDEVADEIGDRFKPHVTLAWPARPHPHVTLAGLAPASAFSCTFDRLALYGMSPWGTCTRAYGAFGLARADAPYDGVGVPDMIATGAHGAVEDGGSR
jgi:hypothetical protein